MTSTTIKVSRDTRDRLKTQAARAHVSLGEHLRRLADAADREARLAGLGAAVDATSRDLVDSHADETEAWERAELEDADDI